MMDYIKLMRPKHYIKNLLIFLPLVFSEKLLNFGYFKSVFLAFIAFCFCSSIVYIINDIKDKDKDKLHEKKKDRPIASGKVNVKQAIILVVILSFLVILFQYLASVSIASLSYRYILVYIIINFAYSFGLKNVPILDVLILALGFLIRVLYGASVIGINVSNWLYLTILSVAFYLGLGKRRNEIIKIGKNSRDVLKYYSKDFLDKNMYMCLAISIVFYSLWTVDSTFLFKNQNIFIWTVPLVIVILMKYSMDIESNSLGDPVDVVLEDKVLLSLILLYGVCALIIMYVF